MASELEPGTTIDDGRLNSVRVIPRPREIASDVSPDPVIPGAEYAQAEDDLSQRYMAAAQGTTVDATIESFMRRVRKPVEEAPAGKPSTGPASVVEDVARVPSVWEKIGGAAIHAPAAVGRAALDVAKGVTMESVPAVVGGVNDAVRNAATGLQSVGDWLDKNVGGSIPVPNTGNETLDLVIQKPLEAFAKALPDPVKAQESTTGHVIREGARFLTGFVPALRAFGGASVPAVIGAGAVTDFATMDPNEKGLANLVGAVPAIGKPIADYLGTDPDDNEALNRLRHAIEGAGFGMLAEGIIRGIKAVALARRAVPEVDAQASLYGSSTPGEALLSGVPDTAPLTVVGKPQPVDKLAASMNATETGVPDSVAAKGVAGAADDASTNGMTRVAGEGGGPDVFVNFGRINAPEDVKQIIADTAAAYKGDINAARRGVQSNEQTAKLADELGMTAEDLLARRKGSPMNAEESLAARRLLNTSAEKLLEMARKAADMNAGAADQFNFRRMLAVHHAIQSEVIAARTETARALQAWSIPAGSGKVEAARSVQMLLDNMGGTAVSADLAKRMALLAGQGVPAAAIANMARKGWAATTTDAVKEAYVMGLLWAPPTHIVNSASNLAVAFQQIYERGAAAKIGDALGSAVDQRVVSGEAIAMTYGLVTSLKDAFRLAGRALKTGETGASTGSKVDLQREPAISTAAIARERQMTAPERAEFAESGMGRAIDFMGEVTRVPGRLLGAEDEFFKTIAYRSEVHAQSLRLATQEGRKGPDLWRRMAEIANDPPEHIRISAADAALYNTFQNETGKWGQMVMGVRNAGVGPSGALNPIFLVLPFIKTPTNILRYSFERSPLAPLVGQWRDDIAAGGARQHLALARLGTGTAIFSTAMDMASNGQITGPGPADTGAREALTRQGWQPWSVKIGDKYYSYSRTDPFGMALAAAGTIAEMSKSRELSPEDYDEMQEQAAHVIAGISKSVVDKTYFRGATEVLEMIHGAERGEGGVTRFTDRQTGSLVPFNSALNFVRRGVDPTQREINSPSDAVAAKIAGMSDKLPPARNLWGEERKPQEVYGPTYNLFSPIAVTAQKESPIDAELERLNIGIDRIKKSGSFQNTQAYFRDHPDVYDEYVRLAGNELKHPAWQMGAKDYLDAVVSGRHSMSDVYKIYSDGPEGGKASFIRNTISEYRRLAQERIMAQPERFGEFIAQVEAEKAKTQELKMPVMAR